MLILIMLFANSRNLRAIEAVRSFFFYKKSLVFRKYLVIERGPYPDGKTSSYHACSCPRDGRLLASWGPN